MFCNTGYQDMLEAMKRVERRNSGAALEIQQTWQSEGFSETLWNAIGCGFDSRKSTNHA